MDIDDTGVPVRLPELVQRVVSLVPSLTEAIAESAPGLLVGATEWCSRPRDLSVTRVGGTKNPAVEAIVELRPDLVLANSEENRAVDLQALRDAGIAVWTTFPRTVPQALVSLARMLSACGVDRPGWLVEAGEVWQQPFVGRRRTALVPIWRRPWMAVGSGTFTGDLLARLGVQNVLADSPERYPRFTLEAVPLMAGVELVVLPDEPYAFSRTDGPEAFAGLPVACVSGRHLTWYGPSLVEARALLTTQLGRM